MTRLLIEPTIEYVNLPDDDQVRDDLKASLVEWLADCEASHIRHEPSRFGFRCSVKRLEPVPEIVLKTHEVRVVQ